MSKGNLQPLFNNGFTNEEVEQLKSEWVDYKAPTVIHHGNPTHEKTKRITMFDIEREIVSQYMDTHMDFKTAGVIYKDLYKLTRQICKQEKKGSFDMQIIRLVQGASAELNEDDQWNRIRKVFMF